MFLYENICCPVCKRDFEDGDDIVTCPQCGTPHHRQCYDLIGRCVNAGLHKTNYDFNAENKETADTVPTASEDAQQYYSPTLQNDGIDANAEKTESQNAQPMFFVPPVDVVFEKDEDTIDGESVADFAAVIRTNITGFIAKFKRLDKSKKSLSWNWGAFFFGSLYILFRKMYKQGIAFLCLFLTLMYGSSAMLYKYAPDVVNGFNSLMTSGNRNITPEQIQQVMSANDMAAATKISYIVMGIWLVLRIIQALFADRFYKNTVSSIIKKVREQLEQGASFMQSPMLGEEQQTLSQVQMKRIYLSRRGGVSFFAPLIALMLISLIL